MFSTREGRYWAVDGGQWPCHRLQVGAAGLEWMVQCVQGCKTALMHVVLILQAVFQGLRG